MSAPALALGGAGTGLKDPLPPRMGGKDYDAPYGMCGCFCGCERLIWSEDEAYGPYRHTGIVCGDCAPHVTRGVL